jgi:hypothetical protein
LVNFYQTTRCYNPEDSNLQNKEGLELDRTPQHLVHGDDVNLLGENIYIIKKNAEVLLDTSKEVGLEVSVEKLVHIHVSPPDYRTKS